MALLTKTLKKQIPKLYSSESIPLDEKMIICKFFNPIGAGDWYVIEGEEKDGDFLFFGLVHLSKIELGYFSLNQLKTKRLPFGVKIERDNHFRKIKVGEVKEG